MLVASNRANAATRVPTTASERSPESAQRFVQAFYDWYSLITMKTSRDPGPPDRIVAIRMHPEWFAPPLSRALQRDWAAQDKCLNYIVGLDWDPFLNSQDPNLGYQVGRPTKSSSGYKAPVFNRGANIDHPDQPWVFAFVAFRAGHWEFTDFMPRAEPGVVQATTMQSLALFRRDRIAKAAHPAPGKPCRG